MRRNNYFKPAVAFNDPGFVFPSGFKIIRPLQPRRRVWATFGTTPRAGLDVIKQELEFFVKNWAARWDCHILTQIFKEYAGGGRFGIEFEMEKNFKAKRYFK